MPSDNTITIVNLFLIVGIVAALIFGWWVGRLNQQLRRQNDEERSKLALEESASEVGAKSH